MDHPWDDFDDFSCEDFDCCDELRLLQEELDDYAECIARSMDDGWFYEDNDPA